MSLAKPIKAGRILAGICILVAAPDCMAHTFQGAAVDRTTEARQLARACEEGRVQMCGAAGTAYIVDEADYERAIALYRRGCEGGIADACADLGGIYELEPLPSFNPTMASEYFERAKRIYVEACRSDDAQSCAALASMLEDRRIEVLDLGDAAALRARARRIFEASCSAGRAAACRDLANSCGWKHDDDKCVLSATRRACELGDVESCCLLGHWHANDDRGAARDAELAARYLELACTGGDGKCCPPAATRYRDGSRVRKDLSRAAALYQKGCDLGDGYSCFELARMYESSKAEGDMGRPRKLRKKACGAGYKEACEP